MNESEGFGVYTCVSKKFVSRAGLRPELSTCLSFFVLVGARSSGYLKWSGLGNPDII
jgi:hypothetical protein